MKSGGYKSLKPVTASPKMPPMDLIMDFMSGPPAKVLVCFFLLYFHFVVWTLFKETNPNVLRAIIPILDVVYTYYRKKFPEALRQIEEHFPYHHLGKTLLFYSLY